MLYFSGMEITRGNIQELRQTANKLLDLADRLEGAPIEVSPEIAAMVASKLNARICLACGQKIDTDGRVRRGQDDACYGTTRNRIRRGEIRERDLVMQGKLTAESQPPGRKARQDLTDEEAAKADVEAATKLVKARRRKK